MREISNSGKKAITKMQAIILAIIVIAAAVGGAYWYTMLSGPSSPPTPSKNGGTVVFGLVAEPHGFDPNRLLDLTENMIVDLMNQGLMRFKYENGSMTSEVEPGLAESFTISGDAMKYTFNLRTGLKFHDGEPINAEAVKFTFDRFLIKGNPLEPPAGSEVWFGGYYGEGYINSVEVVDNYTVNIVLTRPYAPIQSLFAAYFSSIISPKALTALGADGYMSNPTGGAGAFKFVEWVRNDHVTLEANDNFYLGRPNIDRVIFKVIPDSAARFLSLKKGEIDAMFGIQPVDVTEAKNDPNLAVLVVPEFATGYIYINTGKPPVDDLRVRKALAYAIDREALVSNLYGGLATVANELLPKGLWPWESNNTWYPYDIEKAKALLAEAGYTAANPLQIELWSDSTVYSYKPVGIEADLFLMDQWKKAGIVVSIKIQEPALQTAARRRSEHTVIYDGWSMDYADPDNYLGIMSPLRHSNWINVTTFLPAHPDNPLCVEFWENAVNGTKISDHNERVRIYKRSEEIIKDQCVLIPLCYSSNIIPVRKTLHDFTPPMISYSWDLIWCNLWTERK